MNEALQYPNEDVNELIRFKARIKNKWLAEDVQLPDKQWLRPNRDHHHYDLHVTEPSGMTIIDTFHFKTKEACMDAIAHVENLRPRPQENELKDEQTTNTNTQEGGDNPEGFEASMESDSTPGKE